MIEFAITDAPDQQFGAILATRRVTLRLRYNVSTDRWSLDLAVDDLPVLHGRRIVAGADLLAPFKLGLGVLFAAPESDGIEPGRASLPGGQVRLFHATDAEVDAAYQAWLAAGSPPAERPRSSAPSGGWAGFDLVDDEGAPLIDDHSDLLTSG